MQNYNLPCTSVGTVRRDARGERLPGHEHPGLGRGDRRLPAHPHGPPEPHLGHGAAQQHPRLGQRRLDGQGLGHRQWPLPADPVRAEQTPVGRHLSTVQQPLRHHIVGRRHRQALGRQER